MDNLRYQISYLKIVKNSRNHAQTLTSDSKPIPVMVKHISGNRIRHRTECTARIILNELLLLHKIPLRRCYRRGARLREEEILLIFRTGNTVTVVPVIDNDRSFGQLDTIIRDVCPPDKQLY